MRTEQLAPFSLQDLYSNYYRGVKGHVPEAPKIALIRRMQEDLLLLQPHEYALDLGSGRQMTERYLSLRGIKPQAQIATIDFARLGAKQLLERRNRNMHHVAGDGAHLPFKTGTFQIVFSDMAIELMPEKAYEETSRVLAPGGRLYINVLSPEVPHFQITQMQEVQNSKFTSRGSRASCEKWEKYWGEYAKGSSNFSANGNAVDLLQKCGLKLVHQANIQANDTKWIELDFMKACKY